MPGKVPKVRVATCWLNCSLIYQAHIINSRNEKLLSDIFKKLNSYITWTTQSGQYINSKKSNIYF